MTTNDVNTDKPIEKVGGWVQRQKHIVYDNPWIEVSHHDVTRPNGSEGIYGAVHFKNRAIGIVAVDAEENIWLVKQSRYVCNEFAIEIPEGGGPFDEDPLLAAKRELEEETGLTAVSWRHFLTLRTSNSVTDEIAQVYLATGLSEGIQNLEDTEDIEVLKMPLSSVIDLVLNATITDAISVAAILKLALLKEQLL